MTIYVYNYNNLYFIKNYIRITNYLLLEYKLYICSSCICMFICTS